MAIISLRYSTTANSRPDPSALVAGEVAINTSTTGSGVFYASDTGALLKVGAAEVSATAPNSTPAGVAGNSLGELWLDTTTDTLNVWDGSSWLPASTGTVTSVAAGTGLSGGTITTSGTITLNTACVIAPTAFTGKGVLLTASATSSPTALTVGTNGQFLSVNSACTGGLEWSTITQCTGTVTSVTAGSGLTGGTITGSGTIALDTACAINPSVLAAKGSLVTASAASTPAELAIGTNGQYLAANSACANGLEWVTSAGSPAATPTVAGILKGKDADDSLSNYIGFGSGDCVTSGTFNTLHGYCVSPELTTGGSNTAVGTGALLSATTGSCNTVVGYAGTAITTGIGNTVVGHQAGSSSTTGGRNTYIGQESGISNTGQFNTGLGAGSFYTPGSLVTGCNNVAIGFCATLPVQSGSCQLVIGYASGCNWLTGCSDKSIQPGGGLRDCTGALGTAGQVLSSTGSGLCWIAAGGGGGGSPATPTVAGVLYGKDNEDLLSSYLGFESGNSVTTGVLNVLLGFCAGHDLTEGSGNTAVGPAALLSATTASCNTAIGLAASSLTTGVCNVAIGHQSGASLVTSAGNVLVGFASGLVADGDNNTAIGTCALDSVSPVTGSNNVAIGYSVSLPSATDSCQLAIGFNTGCNWLTGCSNKNIRPGAGILDCTGSPGTAGQVLSSTGTRLLWCTPAAPTVPAATPTVAGGLTGRICNNSASVGNNALLNLTTGSANIAMGGRALCSNTTGLYNTALGAISLEATTTGVFNTGVGTNALRANTTGNYNTSVGVCTLRCNTTGACNIAMGSQAGSSISTGCNNIGIGHRSLYSATTGSGNIQLGGTTNAGSITPVFSITTENNRVVMGSTAVTNAYIQVAWTAVSDARDKTSISALPVGLEFVSKLNPVSYQFRENRESEIPNGPVRYGFLAQEVLEIEGENPVLVDTENPDHLKITSDYMNAVLVKAIQELSVKVESLEQKLTALG